MFSDEDVAHFRAFGFVVARQELHFRYLPMMSARTPASLALLRGLFPATWDGGYDVDRYGADWQRSGLPWVGRLGELGAYAAADVHERFARGR